MVRKTVIEYMVWHEHKFDYGQQFCDLIEALHPLYDVNDIVYGKAIPTDVLLPNEKHAPFLLVWTWMEIR